MSPSLVHPLSPFYGTNGTRRTDAKVIPHVKRDNLPDINSQAPSDNRWSVPHPTHENHLRRMAAVVSVRPDALEQAKWYGPAEHAFFGAVVELSRGIPVVRAIDALEVRVPGVNTAWDALRALHAVCGAWNGWVRLTPDWSVDDWYEARDYAAGWAAQNSEDAWMRLRAHGSLQDAVNLLDAWSGDGQNIAAAMLREHAVWSAGAEVELVAEPATGPAWPSTGHLRLHYLADRQGGWTCRDCGVGLVDVCRDDDMATDDKGGRYVSPGSGKRLPTVDHGVPQSLGGSNLPANLALVCRPCNSRKGAA